MTNYNHGEELFQKVKALKDKLHANEISWNDFKAQLDKIL